MTEGNQPELEANEVYLPTVPGSRNPGLRDGMSLSPPYDGFGDLRDAGNSRDVRIAQNGASQEHNPPGNTGNNPQDVEIQEHRGEGMPPTNTNTHNLSSQEPGTPTQSLNHNEPNAQPTDQGSDDELSDSTSDESNDNNHNPELPRPPRRKRRASERAHKKNTKAGIRVGTLNMRGFGNPSVYHRDNKWKYINNLVKKKRIGIIALQETHLTDERREQIEQRYTRRLKIFISADPENPTGKGGVAIVLNKELARTDNTRSTEIVPGRALLVEVQWHKEEKIAILAIYAPNVSGSDGRENAKLWKDITAYYDQHPRTPKPKILLGDFNMVEAGLIDRWPAHNDPEEAIEALDTLKIRFSLKDEWRNTHPGEKRFTYIQAATNSQSRLDRIYITEQLQPTAGDWKIEPSGIPNADHSLTSVRVAHTKAPKIGRGRWTIPDFLLKDKGYMEYVHKKGLQTQKRYEELITRTATENPQTIWYEFKS